MKFDDFRLQLCHEAQIWQDEGIINTIQYQQLATRYQFDYFVNNGEIKKISNIHPIRDTANQWLIALGGIAIGTGVMMFLTASWHELARGFKVILLLGILIFINSFGFLLWRKALSSGSRKLSRKRLIGQGLILLGFLILGINIVVISQEFSLQLSLTQIYLLWAVGGLMMAYSLEFACLASISLILLGIAYWQQINGFSELMNLNSWDAIAIQYLHLPIWIVGVTLAYICRSLWLFVIAAILFTIIFILNFQNISVPANLEAFKTALIFIIPPILIWTYNDALFFSRNLYLFRGWQKKLSFWILLSWLYLFSWQWFWLNSPLAIINTYFQPTPLNIFLGIDFLILLLLISWQSWLILRHQRVTNHWKNLPILGLIIVVGSVPIWRYIPVEIAVTFFNSLFMGIGVALIGYGETWSKRLPFWNGILLLGLQIISRVWEYTDNLFLISLTWIGCGLLISIAGIWYENRWHKRKIYASDS